MIYYILKEPPRTDREAVLINPETLGSWAREYVATQDSWEELI